VSTAQVLRAEVDANVSRLLGLPDEVVTADRGPGAWTRKQILGHLIDSASNNQQRFVLAPLGEVFVGPGYDQRHWVDVHAYRDRAWSDIVSLWAAFNRHLAHAMEAVPSEKLSMACRIGDGDPVTLDWLMNDYVAHMRHHLAQILEERPRT
jgi:hypothetical protein